MAPWPFATSKAIHKAVASGDVARLKQLLARNSTNVNARNAHGTTALHMAVCRGDRHALKALLAHPDIDPNAQDSDGKTPLHLAVSAAMLLAVEALVKHSRIDVNLADRDGRSPLHTAVHVMSIAQASSREQQGTAQVEDRIVALLSRTPGINHAARDQRGRTPLSWAAHLGLAGTVAILADDVGCAAAGAALADADGNTALHKAVACREERAVALMVDRLVWRRGVDLNAKNNKSETALHVAARSNTSSAIRTLVNAGANLDVRRDSDGATPFHVAVNHCSYDFMRDVRSSVDPPWRMGIFVKDNDGNTPLHLAAERGDEEMVHAILDLYKDKFDPDGLPTSSEPDPIDVAQANNKGEAAADLAASRGHVGLTILLLQYGSVESDAARSRRRESAFKILPALLATSTSDFVCEQGVDNLLSWAAQHGVLDLLQALQQHASPFMLEYPIVLAAAGGHLDVVRYLVEAGVDPNTCRGYPDAETPLAAAANHGHIEVMRFLLSLDQTDANRGMRWDGDVSRGDTPLMCAIRARSAAALSLLLSDELLRNSRVDLNLHVYGPDSAENGERNLNPLLLICTLGYDDMAELLVRQPYLEQKRLMLNVRDDDGNGLLSLACKGGHWRVAEVLLSTRSWPGGLDVRSADDAEGPSRRTPFSYACSSPAPETAALFLKGDLIKDGLVDPDSTDDSGLTPFAHACRDGRTGAVDLLLNSHLIERGLINPDSRDQAGMTPLAHACKEGRVETVDLLLKSDLIKRGLVNPDSTDNDGTTPLGHACKEGQLATAKLILDSCLWKDGLVNLNARDERGRSPLGLACSYTRWEVVELFLGYFLSGNHEGVVDFGAVDKSGDTLVDLAGKCLKDDEDSSRTMLVLLDGRLVGKDLVDVSAAARYMSQRAQTCWTYYGRNWMSTVEEHSPMWPVMRRLAELGHPVSISQNAFEDDHVFWCGVEPG